MKAVMSTTTVTIVMYWMDHQGGPARAMGHGPEKNQHVVNILMMLYLII